MFLWRDEVLPGVSVAFTDTGAGNLALHVGDKPDDVNLRRVQLEEATGLGSRKFQFMDQVHGNHVEFIASHGTGPTADAMVSAAVIPNGSPQPLAVMVADCVPVVLVGTDSSANPVIAVAHAGRPGVASGIVASTVAGMRDRGALDIRAWVGPSICGACYEVPEQLRSEVAAAVPATWSSTSWGTPSVDLPAGVRAQLDAAGVAVEYLGECTLESDALFSYRRDQRTGRFAGLVWTHD
ncbi:polyphenol oxidase family protein [Paenarthrobacter sp. NPDC057981]|uniref:polyphenol oxidase family protein n=1 Tax=Paenarthrobacter sp. NPDC057981 TaxID=3346297 RepID=UPI0036DDC26C